MELLRKAASFGPPIEDLKDIYILFIRSILEQSATVWHSGITSENSSDLKRVQKSAMKIILNDNYSTYENALAKLGLESLESRREDLCLNFWTKNKKLAHMFPENIRPHGMSTRHEEKYKVQFANTDRLKNSPIIYMQNLLNQNPDIQE